MDKKPQREPSAESDEGHTTFALKQRQAKPAAAPAAADEIEDAVKDEESEKSTLHRRATRYPGADKLADDKDDDDDDAPKEEESLKSTSKRRATVYPAANKFDIQEDDDISEDDETKKGETFALKSRATTSPGQNDEKDDDKEAPEVEEPAKPAAANMKRRATTYPTAAISLDQEDEPEDDDTPKPVVAAIKRRATIHHIVAEKTISDDEDEVNYKPTALAISRRSTIYRPQDSAQGGGSDEVKALPQSALKSRPTTPTVPSSPASPISPTTVDNIDETQKAKTEASKDSSPPSSLKSQPDTAEMKIPSFISKSSESFAYYQYNLKTSGEDANNYDFAAARPAMKKSSVPEAILHLIKVCLGSAWATIPEAYKQCGLWTAFGLNIFIGIAVAYGMYILTRSAQRLYGRVQVPMMLYPDIAEACMEAGPWKHLRKYGLWFRYTVDFTIGLGLFSACCIYQVAIAKVLKQLVEGSYVVLDEGNPPLSTYIILLMLPCLLICMITTLKYLAPFVVVADVYVVAITVATIYYGFTVSTVSALELPAFKTVSGVFEFFGVCIFSINGIGATMSIENYMSAPKKFPIVAIIGVSIVVCEVILIGFFGYWGYGEKVQSVITLNYPYRPFPIVLKIFMALMLYISYALNFWVAFELVWYYAKMKHAPAQYWFWERIYRAMFVIIIAIVAYLLPNVYYFTALAGVLCFSNLTFIYPAFIELVVDWKDPGLGFLRWRLLKFSFFVLIGMAVFCGGTYMNAEGLIMEVFYKNATSGDSTTTTSGDITPSSSTTTSTTTTTTIPTTVQP